MCGGWWAVSPYPKVECGLGTCLSTGDTGGTNTGWYLGRDGEGGVHVLVVADRG